MLSYMFEVATKKQQSRAVRHRTIALYFIGFDGFCYL